MDPEGDDKLPQFEVYYRVLMCGIIFAGHPTQWQNMTLAGMDGVAQGRVGKNSVSVLVDHF